MRAAFAALPIFLALASAAQAQALRPFCADRPGKATPPCILDAGHVQLEVALADAVFQGHDAHEDTYAVGASEVRFGLTRRLEAGFSWTPLIIDRQRGASQVSGVGDLALGVRWAITDPDAQGGAQVSVEPFVTAPTATHGLGAGGWTGGVRLPVAGPLPNDFTLGVVPETDVARNASGGGTHLAASLTVAVGHGFGDTTLGAELWGQVDDDPSHRAYQATFDLTAAQALGKTGQLDAGLNLGLNHDTPGVEVYVGVAHRF